MARLISVCNLFTQRFEQKYEFLRFRLRKDAPFHSKVSKTVSVYAGKAGMDRNTSGWCLSLEWKRKNSKNIIISYSVDFFLAQIKTRTNFRSKQTRYFCESGLNQSENVQICSAMGVVYVCVSLVTVSLRHAPSDWPRSLWSGCWNNAPPLRSHRHSSSSGNQGGTAENRDVNMPVCVCVCVCAWKHSSLVLHAERQSDPQKDAFTVAFFVARLRKIFVCSLVCTPH